MRLFFLFFSLTFILIELDAKRLHSRLGISKRIRDDYYDDQEANDDNDGGQIWALLVAGSNGWYNYRHQADVAHAYHTLQQHGVQAENIVTMMYDDIANNQQ